MTTYVFQPFCNGKHAVYSMASSLHGKWIGCLYGGVYPYTDSLSHCFSCRRLPHPMRYSWCAWHASVCQYQIKLYFKLISDQYNI